MKRQNKKGFTIIELVIVIAVIAILASVLIPVFSNIVDKANVSKDTQLVRNLNAALSADLEDHETMYDALQAAEEYGYNVGKINASATDNEILWDSKNDCFVYLNKGTIEYIPNSKTVDNVKDHEYWVIASTPSTKYSTYYTGSASEVTVTTGFDAGEKTGITVNVDTDATIDLVIRANSVADTYNITAPNANIKFYGTAGEVNVEAVKDNSLHIYGSVEFLQVKAGRVVAEDTAVVKGIHIAAATAKLDIDADAVVEVVTKETGLANVTVNGYTETIAEVDAETAKAGAKLFAAGNGTEALPFIIETAEQFKNIDKNYENYAYYKVADGVEILDCSDINLINLHGSFDGNGVKLTNINKVVLFKNIGYNVNNETIVVENFEANISGAPALAQQVVNAGTTTFKNIKITGYIEGSSNLGSFYRFGAGQAGGANYTVKFMNCKSSANIFTTEGSVGGFVGHAFPGAGYSASFDVDGNCEFTGTVYSANANQGDEFFGIGGGNITKNGEPYEDKKAERAKLASVEIALTDDGYTTTVADNAQSIAINIAPQLTAYKEDGEVDPNNAGITGLINLAVIENVSSGETLNILESITELRIVNGANENGYSVSIEDGILTIYTNRSANFQTGAVRLEVVQYDNNGSILAIGRIEIGQITK